MQSSFRILVMAAASAMLVSCSAPVSRPEVVRETTAGRRPVELLVLRDARRLEAAVAPSEGGELSSLKFRFRHKWVELIYRARDYSPTSGWPGRAPFLWPATGRNFATGMKPVADLEAIGGYDWQGRRYPMPLHGFVRSMPWKLETSGADAGGAWVRLSLTDTPETRLNYPFGFTLTVEYRLAGDELAMLYSVTAASTNHDAMFFSAGNHMTFRAPFVEGSEALAMLMQTPCTEEYPKTPEGIPTGESRPRSVSSPVRLADFDARSAVSLGGYTGDPWLRLTDPAGLRLNIQHHADSLPPPPVVQFNIWGDPAHGYFSPEPWVGLQSSFVQRKGLVNLAPGGTWKWTVRLRPEPVPEVHSTK